MSYRKPTDFECPQCGVRNMDDTCDGFYNCDECGYTISGPTKNEKENNKKFLDAMESLVAAYEQEGGVTIGISVRIADHEGDEVNHYRWNGGFEFVATTDSFEDPAISKLRDSQAIALGAPVEDVTGGAREKTFMQRVLEGSVSAEAIDDAVEQWHDSPSDKSVYAFLGMTWPEYAAWIEDPRALPGIVENRKQRLARTVNVNELKRVKEYLTSINHMDINDIIWVEDGKEVSIPDAEKTLSQWGFIGLNNVDFVFTGCYQKGITEEGQRPTDSGQNE